MESDYKLCANWYEDLMNVTEYRKLIGKLIYVTHTRHGIAFPMRFLRRFMHRPTKMTFGAAKHILRYLAGTIDASIMFRKDAVGSLIEFFLTMIGEAVWRIGKAPQEWYFSMD